MNLLLGQILNGIATGMLYALMGLGLSLITGVLNIPNFAHGALFAVGAYLLVTMVNVIGNFWLAAVHKAWMEYIALPWPISATTRS